MVCGLLTYNPGSDVIQQGLYNVSKLDVRICALLAKIRLKRPSSRISPQCRGHDDSSGLKWGFLG